jgi:hypothetical protein
MPAVRTALVGDWYRAHPQFGSGPGTVRGNLTWLGGLLSAGRGLPISEQTVILPDASPSGFRSDLAHPGLQDLYDKDPVSGWAACFDSAEAFHAFPRLYEQLSGVDIVIGFEIPPVMRRVLSAKGLRYLSVHIHPLRFLPDLVFGLHSNCPVLQAGLAAIAVPERAVQQRVASLSARLAKLAPGQAALPAGIPVLFGQTAADASLISGGSFTSWYDRRDELAGLLDGFSHVAFVRHPHATWPNSMLEWLRDDLAKTVIAMEGNSYPVLMSGQSLGPVISLSSSVGVEAAAFGHDSHFLLANPVRAFAVSGLDNPEQIMVGHGLLIRETWEGGFSGDAGLLPQTDPFELGSDHVRSTLEAWSYAGIAGDGPLPECKKIIMPSRHCTQAQCDELFASLARLPSGAEGGRSTMIDAAAKQGSMVRCLPPAFNHGVDWEWDHESELLALPGVEGIGPPEGDGAWFDGSRVRIGLKLSPAIAPGSILVGKLRFSFFRGVLDQFPVLLLRIDDHPVAAWLHRRTTDPFHVLSFAIAVPAAGHCTLSLETSHSNSPTALGIGTDSRRLGFILHGLAITVCNGAPATGGTAVLSLWGFGDGPIELPYAQNWDSNVAA